MAATLSKSRLLAFRQCPKRLWLQSYRRDLATDDANAKARFAAGNRVGEIARRLRPEGRLVGHVDDIGRALRETAELLDGARNVVLFEAAISDGQVLVRADVLERQDGRYRLVEVKSAGGVKATYAEDVAIQTFVLQRAGLDVESVRLAHVDATFVYPGGGDYAGLFTEADMDGAVQPLLDEVPAWVADAQRILAGELPDADPGPHCSQPYACEFSAWCGRDEPEYPVTILPRGGALAAQLRAEGYRDLRDVPESRLVKDVHLRVLRATRAGKPDLRPDGATALRALPYPRAFLDFETIAPAVPIWAGTRPYQAIPVQWSCHVRAEPGRLVALGELVAHGRDPRRDFAESLLRALPKDGPVFAYNAGFERRVLVELAALLPDLATPLVDAADRLVDLLPIVRERYYHPAMKGSWSLKDVLPTVAPELAYSSLEGGVRSGGDVEPAYLAIIAPATDALRRDEMEAALVNYCARDTLALVRLVEFLEARPPAADTAAAVAT